MHRVRISGLPSALLLLSLLALWEVAVRLAGVPPYILPPPTRILATLAADLPLLLRHAGTTLSEVAAGLALGAASGVTVALVGFYVPAIGRALHPFVLSSQVVPVFALAPLLVLWFGYGLWPKVIVVGLITFFPIAVNLDHGLRSVGPDLVDLLITLGAREATIFRLVRLPAALPAAMAGLKVAATVALAGAVIGEWIGGQGGLGYVMIQANAVLRADRVFAALVVLTLLGIGLFGAVAALERCVLRWRPRDSRRKIASR